MAPGQAWPAGPAGGPLLGSLRDFSDDRLGFLSMCAREYGDFVPFRVRRQPVIFLNHPDHIETVVQTRAADYSKNYLTNVFHPVLRKQLLLKDTDSWLEQRRLAQPDLRPDRMPEYSAVMVDRARRLCEGWRDGQTIDVPGAMRRLTLEVLSTTLFDIDVSREAAEVASIVDVVLDDVSARAAGWAHVPFVVPTPANLRLLFTLRRLDRILDEMIADRRRLAAGRRDLLSRLVTLRTPDGRELTNQEVKFTALPLFFAGHETTAMSLTWTLLLLARHPEVEQRLVEELNGVLGDRPAAHEDVARLPYANCVVSESLRMFPPIWGFGREAVRPTAIGQYQIPVGTAVFMSQWVLQRDPRYFGQPDEFLPERWADGLARRLPRYAYLPFGVGARRCLGNTFAVLEAVLVLATLLRRFRLVEAEPVDAEPDPLITLRPRGRVVLVARERR